MVHHEELPAKNSWLNGDAGHNPFVPAVGGDVVDVKVGSNYRSKIYHVHEEVLAASLFFQNVLNFEWPADRMSKPIDLSDEEPVDFEHYLQYLYARNIPADLDSTDAARLYVLGEKLIHEFQDAIMDKSLVHATEPSPRSATSSTINIIYEGTSEGSPARRLVVDMICWLGTENWLQGSALQTFHQDFVNDAFVAMLKFRSPVSSMSPGFWMRSHTICGRKRRIVPQVMRFQRRLK